MTPEQHRLMRERIGAGLSGRLPADEREELEAHLAACAECRAEREALLPVLAALRNIDPDEVAVSAAPSPDLLGRIMASTVGRSDHHVAAGGRQSVPGDGPVSLAARGRRPIGRVLLALAAAVALLAAGVGIGSQAFPRAVPGPPFETVSFEQAPPGVDASGRLIAHTWGTEIQLIVTGLDAGQEYHASFVGDDGTAIDGGTFIGITGPMVCNLNAAILRPDVTILRITTNDGAPVLEADLQAPSG